MNLVCFVPSKEFIVLGLLLGMYFNGCAQLNMKAAQRSYVESGPKIYTDLANEKAVAEIQKHLGDYENDVQGRFRLVKIYLYEYFFEDAIQELERIIAVQPNNIEAHILYAFTLIKSERTDLNGAEKVLKKAVILAPNRGDLHIQLALVYVDLNRKDEAIVQGKQALEVSKDPKQQATAYLLLSSLDQVNANDHYQEALRLDPSIGSEKNKIVRIPVLIQEIPWMYFSTHPDPQDRIIRIDALSRK